MTTSRDPHTRSAGNIQSDVRLGDYYYYGHAVRVDYEVCAIPHTRCFLSLALHPLAVLFPLMTLVLEGLPSLVARVFRPSSDPFLSPRPNFRSPLVSLLHALPPTGRSRPLQERTEAPVRAGHVQPGLHARVRHRLAPGMYGRGGAILLSSVQPWHGPCI